MGVSDTIRAYCDAFNRENREDFFALLAEDVVHDINEDRREIGKDAFRGFLERYKEKLTDIIILEGTDGISGAAEFVIHGEYVQTDEGLPEARGQKYVLPAGAFFEIRDGKVVHITDSYDVDNLIAQVGK